jgi:hypothetical protein
MVRPRAATRLMAASVQRSASMYTASGWSKLRAEMSIRVEPFPTTGAASKADSPTGFGHDRFNRESRSVHPPVAAPFKDVAAVRRSPVPKLYNAHPM